MHFPYGASKLLALAAFSAPEYIGLHLLVQTLGFFRLGGW